MGRKAAAAKAVPISEASFVGKELSGPQASFHEPDLSGHEHAQTPLEDLDALLDREFSGPAPESSPRDTADDKPEAAADDAAGDDATDATAPPEAEETAPEEASPAADDAGAEETPAAPVAEPDAVEARLRAAEERWEARLALERARNERLEGRLAGLQDFVKKNRTARDDYAEPQEQPAADDDLRQKVESISARQAEADQTALNLEIVHLFNTEFGLNPRDPLDPNLMQRVTAAKQRYAADMDLAFQSDSPQAARALILAVVRNIAHDVKAGMAAEGKAKEADKRKALAAKTRERKIALAPVAGAGTKAGVKPAAFDPWSAEMDDLGALIDKEFGITG